MQPTQNTATQAEPTRTAGSPSPINVAATLRAAASYIDRHGWTQKALYEVHGPTASVLAPCACLVGAIAMVTFGCPVDAPATLTDDPAWPEFILALVWMDQYLDVRDGVTPYEYNDAIVRSAGDVTTSLHAGAYAWDLIEAGAA